MKQHDNNNQCFECSIFHPLLHARTTSFDTTCMGRRARQHAIRTKKNYNNLINDRRGSIFLCIGKRKLNYTDESWFDVHFRKSDRTHSSHENVCIDCNPVRRHRLSFDYKTRDLLTPNIEPQIRLTLIVLNLPLT